MNYAQSLEYINSAKNRGIVPGLENISLLCRQLGYPNKRGKTVHIAGTNGKGSVGAFLGAVLNAAGLRAGRFVSPAVLDYREIMLLDGEMITERDFAHCMTIVKAAADKLPPQNRPTAFELETAAAFVYFDMCGCDYAIIECGMGGRLDATNVTDKVLAVFTSISIDHSAFLGSTIEEIAAEKAGIITDGCGAVSADQRESVKKILLNRKKDVTFVKNCDIINTAADLGGTVFDYGDFKNVKIRLCGKYQTENAALAIEAALKLGIAREHIYKGLENAVWRARFDVVCTNPVVVIDGAHNYDAAFRLRESLNMYFDGRPLYFVMGMLADKEYKKVVDVTAPLADKIFTITPKNSRGLDGRELAHLAGGEYVPSVDKAVSMAVHCAEKNGGAAVIFGSLSFLNEIYDFFEKRDCYGKI